MTTLKKPIHIRVEVSIQSYEKRDTCSYNMGVGGSP
jgi:hypothetical protein